VQGSAVRLVQASIDPAELLRTVPGLPNGLGDAETTVHVESDGRLTLQWSGAPSVAQAGGCGADYQTEFVEGSDVVVLRLVELPSTATETPKACNAVAYPPNRYRFTAARPGQQDPRTGRVWLRRPACLAAQFRDNVFASAAAFSAPKTDAISGNERGSRPSTSVQVKAATVHRAVAPTPCGNVAVQQGCTGEGVPVDPPGDDSRTGASCGAPFGVSVPCEGVLVGQVLCSGVAGACVASGPPSRPGSRLEGHRGGRGSGPGAMLL